MAESGHIDANIILSLIPSNHLPSLQVLSAGKKHHAVCHTPANIMLRLCELA
jgi:hypothetical protein